MVEIDNKELFYFKGQFTFESIGELLNQIKDEVELSELPITIYKRVLTVTIELLENIIRYNPKINFPEFKYACGSYFKMVRNADMITVYAGNPIKNEDVETLKKFLDMLNALSKDELRNLYRETLTNGQFTHQGGAGLGLMDILKASNGMLHYSFEDCNESYKFYHLHVNISTKN
jgi:hypothetical protein